MPELTWVTEGPSNSSSDFIAGRGVGRTKDEHKKVRKHAAHISAAKRLATIKQKERDEIMELVRQKSSTALARPKSKRRETEDGPPPWFITRLLAESSWYQTAVQMNRYVPNRGNLIKQNDFSNDSRAALVKNLHGTFCGTPSPTIP